MLTVLSILTIPVTGILQNLFSASGDSPLGCLQNLKCSLISFNTFSLNDIINEITEIIIELDVDENKKCEFLILLSEIDNIKNKNVNYDIIIIKILSEYLALIN